MKRAYMRPAMQVAGIEQQHIICDSGWETIGPGQPNQPAGARRRGCKDWDDWDDEEMEED